MGCVEVCGGNTPKNHRVADEALAEAGLAVASAAVGALGDILVRLRELGLDGGRI